MKKILIGIIIILLLTGCSTKSAEVEKAVSETLAVIRSTDAVSKSTPTVSSTSTMIMLPTKTTTPTPEPTFTAVVDNRIIDTPPQNMLCTKADLPKEGKYYLPEDGTSVNTNLEVINARGIKEGREYITETGRVTGWWIDFFRGNISVHLPDDIFCGVYIYKTSTGSQLAVKKYFNITDDGWTQINNVMDGTLSQIIWKFQKYGDGGQKNTDYDILVSYKNVVVEVWTTALEENDINIEGAMEIANKMLERIKQEPLVDPADAILVK